MMLHVRDNGFDGSSAHESGFHFLYFIRSVVIAIVGYDDLCVSYSFHTSIASVNVS